MECKFITNGLSIDYFGIVKPCCVFRSDQNYQKIQKINQIDLVNWHQSPGIIKIQQDLSNNRWPTECKECQDIENQKRGDSMRLNAENAYSSYDSQDITLEIRGGTTCNFACQTCWPQASSRVAQFYRQSDIDFIPAHDMDWDFNLLQPIKHRLRNITLLGGEPFYDKRCLKLLEWIQKENIAADLTIFTNGSVLNRNFLQEYSGKLTIVFSIDAVGSVSEYIRFGSDWHTVKENYEHCRSLPKVETRINVTTSPYNYYYLFDLISWIAQDWPSVVTFGTATTSKNSYYMDESVFPLENRATLIKRISQAIEVIEHSNIERMQQLNASNALKSIVENLKDMPYDQSKHKQIQSFVNKMDRAKNIDIWDYCPEVAGYLDINPTRLA